MAGYSTNGEFLKEITNVQRLIHEFSSDNGTPRMSPYVDRFLSDSMKSSRNIDNCQNMVEKLKKEISSLESDLESQSESLLGFSNTELDQIQEMLKLVERKHGFQTKSMMVSLTGIHFDDFTRRPIGQEDGRIVVRQHLLGHCHHMQFEVVFDVEEVQTVTRLPGKATTVSNKTIVITHLQIKVDPQIEENLREFINKCERRLNLQPFLRTYSKYAEWFQHRRRTYGHFKEAYHKEVCLPAGSTGPLLEFSRPGQTRIVFLLSWVIHIDEDDEVHQIIDLVPKASLSVHDLDDEGLLKSVPEKFLLMVKTLGLEHALKSLIESVCKIDTTTTT
ncbi:centromere protein P-like isoform X2 [Anneissia japonica]|uniref:centromere protein P-like isoform X2 n=1 Tax=Anneissia japonica TaxID=1529436 RepID=UPI001425719E|nr:centromere protein P-like isoform X2 [Anneissia japonica]